MASLLGARAGERVAAMALMALLWALAAPRPRLSLRQVNRTKT